MKGVVDTGIFNKLADGMPASRLLLPAGAELVVTHIQVDELNNTKDQERRARLFLAFASLAPGMVPTESFILDVSRLDHGKLSDGVLIQALKGDLDALNGGKANNWHDALIAEVALTNGYTLITSDYHLAQVARAHGGAVHHVAT